VSEAFAGLLVSIWVFSFIIYAVLCFDDIAFLGNGNSPVQRFRRVVKVLTLMISTALTTLLIIDVSKYSYIIYFYIFIITPASFIFSIVYKTIRKKMNIPIKSIKNIVIVLSNQDVDNMWKKSEDCKMEFDEFASAYLVAAIKNDVLYEKFYLNRFKKEDN